MIWGGLGQNRQKKTQQLLTQEKKTQLSNPEEKKSSTISCRGKKVQLLVAEEKNSTQILCQPPPRSLMVRPLGHFYSVKKRLQNFSSQKLY